MGLIPLILWEMVEILHRFPARENRLGKRTEAPIDTDYRPLCLSGLETGPVSKKGRITIDLARRRKAGFRNIAKVNWQSRLGASLPFLPFPLPLNHPGFLSHPEFLSFLN